MDIEIRDLLRWASAFAGSALAALLLGALGCGAHDSVAAADGPDGGDDGSADVRFARDIVPILDQHCVKCHDGPFRGDFRTAMTAWSVLTGPVRHLPTGFGCSDNPPTGLVVPGNPSISALWQLVGLGVNADTGDCPGTGTTPPQRWGMPKGDPRGVLADFDPKAASMIGRWIEQGALND